jgi:hypothetical protein
MMRFLAIFAVVLILGLGMMAAILSQYGYSLLDSEMQVMIAVCVAVAAYVSWRISGILKSRQLDLKDRPAPGGAGQGKLAALFGGRSRAQAEREARLEARRRKLIEEGKMSPDEAPATQPPAEAPPPRPGSSAAVRDRMAARAERVRKAREEGKI